jgi:hypothetical protein
LPSDFRDLDGELHPEYLEDLPVIEHPEHMTTLLLSPSLRNVEFDEFYLPNSLCQAVGLALKTGSPITCLDLNGCNFSEGGGGAIVHALQRNPTLEVLNLYGNELDDGIFDALTSVLLVNTTLVELAVHPARQFGSIAWLYPFFVALRINTSLKNLDVKYLSLSDELVCGALREVLAKNSVLEELTLYCDIGSLLGDTDVVSWRRTLPFLRDNKTLKSLVIVLDEDLVEPHVANLCIETVVMLEDNISLECLDICNLILSSDDYFTALESLKHNATLKTLLLHPKSYSISDDGKIKHLISLVKKNYGLENLDLGLSAQDKTGEVGTILRRNKAGRRYLIEDAGSMAKGVEVLVAVRNDLGCLFYHLLENPLLCDLEHPYVATGTIAAGPVHGNKRQRTSK